MSSPSTSPGGSAHTRRNTHGWGGGRARGQHPSSSRRTGSAGSMLTAERSRRPPDEGGDPPRMGVPIAHRPAALVTATLAGPRPALGARHRRVSLAAHGDGVGLGQGNALDVLHSSLLPALSSQRMWAQPRFLWWRAEKTAPPPGAARASARRPPGGPSALGSFGARASRRAAAALPVSVGGATCGALSDAPGPPVKGATRRVRSKSSSDGTSPCLDALRFGLGRVRD